MVKANVNVLAVAAGLVLAQGAASEALALDTFSFEAAGAISAGMGGIAITQDIGISGMIKNPATLTLRPRPYLEGGLHMLAPSGVEATQINTGETAEGKDSLPFNGYYIPQAGGVWRDGPLALGLGLIAEGGFGTDYGSNSFLSRLPSGVSTALGVHSKAMFLRAPLAAAYDVTPDLTFGAAIDLVHAGLNLQLLRGADQVGALLAQGRLTGTGPLLPTAASIIGTGGGVYMDVSSHATYGTGTGTGAFGVGGRLGATYRVLPGTTLGAFYQFETALEDLTGGGTMIAIAPNGTQVAVNGDYTIRDVQLPAEVGIGISHDVIPQVTLSFDYKRVFWSDAINDFKIRFDSPTLGSIDMRIPQQYNDINVFALGVQYRPIEALTLRAGFRISDDVVDGSQILPVVPVITTKHLSVGVGYAFSDNWRIDAAYSHAFENSVTTSPPNGSAVNPTRVTNSIDSILFNVTASF